MRVTIKGLDKLKQKLNKLPKAISTGAYNATYELTETVATKAASRVQASTQHGTGELAGSIKTEVSPRDNGITGRVWSDNPVALFREFGTGPVGEASQKDLPDGVNPMYTQEPWFIPVNAVDVDLNALYNIPKVTIKGNEFYFTHGQPARPFLYPSFRETMGNAEKVYKEHMKEAIRDGVK